MLKQLSIFLIITLSISLVVAVNNPLTYEFNLVLENETLSLINTKVVPAEIISSLPTQGEYSYILKRGNAIIDESSFDVDTTLFYYFADHNLVEEPKFQTKFTLEVPYQPADEIIILKREKVLLETSLAALAINQKDSGPIFNEEQTNDRIIETPAEFLTMETKLVTEQKELPKTDVLKQIMVIGISIFVLYLIIISYIIIRLKRKNV
jgi:hypothetical protein